MKRVLLTALLAAAPLAAIAEETVMWGEFGNWQVWVDPTQGNGCFGYVSYEDGSFFRAGFDNTDNSNHVFFSNPLWKSLVPDQTYTMRLFFDPIEKVWDADVLAQKFDDGTLFLRMDSTDLALLDDVLKASTARVEFKGKEIASYDLTGSSRAINGVFDCQDDPSVQGDSADPFVGADEQPNGVKSDPFAN